MTTSIRKSFFLAALSFQICSSFYHTPIDTNVYARRKICTNLALSDDGERPIEDMLHQALADGDKQVLSIDAFVSAKRSFGSSLVFVDLFTEKLDVCQALLRREHYGGHHYQGHRKCLLPGTKVRIEGIASPARNPGSAVLLVHSVKLLQMPKQPQHIRTLLSLGADGELPFEEVAAASLLSSLELQGFLNQKGNIKALSKSICSNLPALPKGLEENFDKTRYQRGFQLPQVPEDLLYPSNYIGLDVSAVNETLSVEATKDLKHPIHVGVVGIVQNRRRFQGNVTAFNLVDRITPLSQDAHEVGIVDGGRLRCILHPDAFDDAEIYGNMLAVGSGVWIYGILTCSETGGNSLWVKEARLVRASWRPITLRYILDLLYEGRLAVHETAEALQLSTDEAEELSEMDDLTARQWRASQISNDLQSSESRVANLSPAILQVLDNYSSLRQAWPVLPTQGPKQASKKGLQKSSPGSNWQRKKRPQLEWMTQEISEVAKAHPSFAARQLHILDIGGGQGRLANYLAQTLGDRVQVHVIDIAKNAIANGAMRANRLNLDVQFKLADASTTNLKWTHPVDIVVALHACGHLSDVALGHAVRHRASFVVCPCCFSSNPHLRVGDEAVEAFLNVPSPDWSALKYLAEVQGDSALSGKSIHTVCSLRAASVASKYKCSIQIKSFPIQYSTRNAVLVGMVDATGSK